MARRKKNSYGSIIHEGGFTVTQKELKELRYLTQKANKLRNKNMDSFNSAIQIYWGNENISAKGWENKLERSAFITEKYSASLDNIKSKSQLKNKLEELREVTSRGFTNRNIQQLRNKIFERVYENTDDKELARNLSKLPTHDLMAMYMTHPSMTQAIFTSDEETIEHKKEELKGYFNRYTKQRLIFNSMLTDRKTMKKYSK